MLPNSLPNENFDIEIWTEGKTDWKILKKAFKELSTSLKIKFSEFDGTMGQDRLLTRCSMLSKHENSKPIVFIFDHDNNQIVNQVMEPKKLFKNWGNNVFSFAIPIPDHRTDYKNISIEFYFSDQELRLTDKNGRRLFLTSEFVEKSGNLIENSNIHVGNKGVLTNYTNSKKAKIIDTDVCDSSDNNIALTKAAFADYVANSEPPFDSLNFEPFQWIIDVIETINSVSKPKVSVYYPEIDEIMFAIDNLPHEEQAFKLAETIYAISYLALEIFCIVAIRCYENQITSGLSKKYVSRAKPIKKALSENFTYPNLQNVIELARVCFHLVDSKAPQNLLKMKEDLEKIESLGDIGPLLDDFEILFPPKFGTPTYAEKHKLNRNFLSFIALQFAQYEELVFNELKNKLVDTVDKDLILRWRNALVTIMQRLDTFFSNPLSLKLIENYDPKQKTYIANIRIYENSQVTVLQKPVSENDDIESKTTDMLFPDGKSLHLYPFLVIKDDRLYFYKGRNGEGFVYGTVFGELEHIDITTKKFDHAVFKTGSEQDLYWTDVLPAVNPQNGIKANILEDPSKFFGRDEQKKIIREEILEIPNQNGILYGPGGIGKTALMLQLAKELYEETELEKILYKNIIWISAKTDFYDYVFGAVEKRLPQFRSLEQILQAILEFFGLKNFDTYSLDEKKYLTLDILNNNKILLVLDNFETVSAEEVEKIIKFFDIEVKRELRKKPDYFKVVITSRKQIPCGFHQVELSGLDYEEAVELMDDLYGKYKHAAEHVSEIYEKEIYKITRGIPIVIKHCFARLFEYSESLNYVLSSFDAASEIVQFSFNEIIQQIEVTDNDKIQLKILILLGLHNYPLMTGQIAKILEIPQSEIENKIPMLVDYQCLSRVFEEGYEKYKVNDEIKLLTTSLTQKHIELSKLIRNLITVNFSIDEQFIYSKDESQLVEIFNNYLSQRNFLEAEKFIQDQIKEKPTSVLLNYYYAKYLKERKHDLDQAISILESIREKSMNNSKLLILLVECYANQTIPNFEKGQIYASQIEELEVNEGTKIELAKFYTHWSASLKIKIGGDPFEDQLRQTKYQNLATHALEILEEVNNRDHVVYHLLAQCYYNLWDYNAALKWIDKAIESAENRGDFSQSSYGKFKEIINDKKRKFRN